MTQSINAAGEAVTYTSNIEPTNELNATSRDVTGEKITKGTYKSATTYIDDDVANNNPDVITRDGSRQYANGEYQPTDIVTIDGFPMAYETAVSMGFMKGDELTSPQEIFKSDAENFGETQEPADTRPEGFQLVDDQLSLALRERKDDAINLFSEDIITNGEVSEAGLNYAQKNIGMNADSVQATIENLRETGGEVLYNHLNVGDEHTMERVNFLVDLSENGTVREKQIIRKMWADAATGKLSRSQAIDLFDDIVAPYEEG